MWRRVSLQLALSLLVAQEGSPAMLAGLAPSLALILRRLRSNDSGAWASYAQRGECLRDELDLIPALISAWRLPHGCTEELADEMEGLLSSQMRPDKCCRRQLARDWRKEERRDAVARVRAGLALLKRDNQGSAMQTPQGGARAAMLNPLATAPKTIE